jgi:hypothetical protein
MKSKIIVQKEDSIVQRNSTGEENRLPLDFMEIDISGISVTTQAKKKDLGLYDNHYKGQHIRDPDYKELDVYKAVHAKSGIIYVLGYWKEENKVFLCLNKERNALIEVPTRHRPEREVIS